MTNPGTLDHTYLQRSELVDAVIKLIGENPDSVSVEELEEQVVSLLNADRLTRFELESSIAGASGKMLYAPPPQEEGVSTVELANISGFQSLDAEGKDLNVKIKAGRKRGFTVANYKNLRIIGGAVDMSISGATTSETAIRLNGGLEGGTAFIEGVYLNGGGAAIDLIDASPGHAKSDVILQNILGENIVGEDTGTHPDLFQQQGSMGKLFAHNITGKSAYHNWFIPQQHTTEEARLSRVNCAYQGGNNSQQIWFDEEKASFRPYPKLLADLYCDPGATGRTLLGTGDTGLIWPKAGLVDTHGNLIGAESDDGGVSAFFPLITEILGRVRVGAPPTGDFVAKAAIGEGYTSPGYVNLHSPRR